MSFISDLGMNPHAKFEVSNVNQSNNMSAVYILAHSVPLGDELQIPFVYFEDIAQFKTLFENVHSSSTFLTS